MDKITLWIIIAVVVLLIIILSVYYQYYGYAFFDTCPPGKMCY